MNTQQEHKVYMSGKKKGFTRPLRGKPVKKNIYKDVNQYIIDSIDGENYDRVLNTDKEKLQFVLDTLRAEYGWCIERHGQFHALKEWMSGLPSAINIAFMNWEILELSTKWGRLPKNPTEAQQDRILLQWFAFISMRIGELFRKHGVK